MSPVEWSPCRPRTIQLPLTASPRSRLSRPQSTISQSDFHPVIRPFSPLRLGRSYRLAPEPDGSPLFTLLPLVACWRYRTPGAPQTARVVAACDSAFPFERQGRLLRSRSISGLYSRSLHSGLQPPCLRFATAVTGRHARLGSRLLARLCRGRHRRRQTSTRLQGATLIEPDRQICRVAKPLLAFAPTEPTVRRYRSGLFRKDLRRVDHCRHAWWITGSGRGKAIRSWR